MIYSVIKEASGYNNIKKRTWFYFEDKESAVNFICQRYDEEFCEILSFKERLYYLKELRDRHINFFHGTDFSYYLNEEDDLNKRQ